MKTIITVRGNHCHSGFSIEMRDLDIIDTLDDGVLLELLLEPKKLREKRRLLIRLNKTKATIDSKSYGRDILYFSGILEEPETSGVISTKQSRKAEEWLRDSSLKQGIEFLS